MVHPAAAPARRRQPVPDAAILTFLVTFICGVAFVGVVHAHGGDTSWIQAYNAGFVRVKWSGQFSQEVAKVDSMLTDFIRFIADCPAVPSTFPFPARAPGSRLDAILKAKVVKVAFQFNSTAAKVTQTPGFPTAFIKISTAIVNEIGKAYQVKLVAQFIDFPTSDTSVRAVINGQADVTDPFYRQWSLDVATQVQRSILATPACTTWAAPISVSWNSTRNKWKTLADIRAAGAKVIIPLYSTVLLFRSEVQALFPKARLILRPKQNFEGNRADFTRVFKEFERGGTTLLIAAKTDINAVLTLYKLNIAGFNTSVISTIETRIVGPVGAYLPLPGAV